MRPNSMFFQSVALSMALANGALADGTELYPDAPPPDASFIRFFGVTEGMVSYAGKTFAISSASLGKYIPVSAAQLTGIEPGVYITVIKAADGTLQTIAEGARDTRLKVHLILVNGSQETLDLRVVEGDVPVLSAVAPMAASQRAVNPVNVELGVFANGADTPVETFELALQRGQNLSFVATADGVRLVPNSFALVQE